MVEGARMLYGRAVLGAFLKPDEYRYHLTTGLHFEYPLKFNIFELLLVIINGQW